MVQHADIDHTGLPGVGAGGGSGLLGAVFYRAGSDSQLASTTSSTVSDIDATNAAVTFTAPASGDVIIEIACYGGMDAGANGFLAVREGSTTLGQSLVVGGTATNLRLRAAFLLTGITAGSHTYKAAFSTSGSTYRMYTGPTYGAFEITVIDAG